MNRWINWKKILSDIETQQRRLLIADTNRGERKYFITDDLKKCDETRNMAFTYYGQERKRGAENCFRL